ncbi:sialin-like [Penaeus vannamei]|uniref:sialin-like n=1 Tax=Penaeus vannamei TaxID=6689 RepID=UPI00387F7AF2
MVQDQQQDNTSRVITHHNNQYLQKTSLGRGDASWDEHTQGQILGACYYGYALTNPLGGRLAETMGGKWVVGMGALLTALLTLLAPLCAALATSLFLAVLVLRGATEGVCFPALASLLALRVPRSRRDKSTSFVYGGIQVGIAVSLMLSGWLCDNLALGGWPSTFYFFGGFGVLVVALWFLLLQEDEEVKVEGEHQKHGGLDEEVKVELQKHGGLDYSQGRGTPEAQNNYTISGSRFDSRCTGDVGEKTPYLSNNKTVTRQDAKFPWRSVLTSLPVWSLTAMHVGSNWGMYTFLTVVPSFLSNVLGFDMKSNGVVSALPSLCMLLFNLLFSAVLAAVSKAGTVSTLTVRRISTLFGAGGPMLCLVGLCFVGYRKDLTIILLCMAMGFKGAMYSGYMCSHQDLTPNYAGTLFGLTNCLATVPGFLAPLVVGIITHDNQTLSAWRYVFLLTALVYLVSSAVFILGISADVQPWNRPQKIKEGEKPEAGMEITRF